MRKISLVWMAIVLLSLGSVWANDGIKGNPAEAMKAQLKKMLCGYEADISEEDNLTAVIRLVVNRDNEFVVLSVDTVDRNLGVFVKSKLNYRKVDVPGVAKGRKYIIPLRIVG